HTCSLSSLPHVAIHPVNILHLAITPYFLFIFFFTDTATTDIYTLSLHDALPISPSVRGWDGRRAALRALRRMPGPSVFRRSRHSDRKSTRLNSSHDQISYAVFCLKKKNRTKGVCCALPRLTSAAPSGPASLVCPG